MAITTVDLAGAGMQFPREFIKAATGTMVAGRGHSNLYLAGIPGAAIAPTPGLAGAALTTYAGQIPFSNPVSGETELGRLQAHAVGAAGTFMLLDRLWHNSGFTITSTAAQTVNSVAWPARDANGSTNGEQVIIGVEVSTITGAGTPTLTMSYTNQAGTAGRTATGTIVGVATSSVGSFYFMGLQAGDTGVRSIQTFTLSASWTSGVIHLVAFRVLARLDLDGVRPNGIDWLTSGAPRLFDNSVPFGVYYPGQTTTTTLQGHVVVTQG